jgi:uncharacterized protein (UPF0335 family)
MTQQIQEILTSLSEDDYFEDEAIILKTYIERIERKLFISDEANAGLGRVCADLKNDNEAFKSVLKELKSQGFQALNCPQCQGGGCPVCGRSGFVFGRAVLLKDTL